MDKTTNYIHFSLKEEAITFLIELMFKFSFQCGTELYKILLNYIINNCIGKFPTPQLETAVKGLEISSKLIETQLFTKQVQFIKSTISMYLHDTDPLMNYEGVKKDLIKVKVNYSDYFYLRPITF